MMRSAKSGLLAGSAAFAAMAIAESLHAQIVVYVDQSRSTGGTGTSWSTAFNDLQDAFNSINTLPHASVRGQNIEFRIAQGVYRPSQFYREAFCTGTPNTASAALLTIRGSWAGASSNTPDVQDFVSTRTILTGDVLSDDAPGFSNRTDNCWLVLSPGSRISGAASPSIVVEGLTLQGGERATIPYHSGGFIAGQNFPAATRPAYLLRDCVIRDNRSRLNGGGIAAFAQTSESSPGLTLIRCSILDNHSDGDGGGCFVAEDATVELQDCTIAGNTAARDGGGIWTGGYLSIERSVIAGNHSNGDGGGLYKDGETFAGYMISSLVAANRSQANGGGVAGRGLNIVSSTFADNSAVWGGGLFMRGWNNTRSCLFYRNAAENNGQQIAAADGPGYHEFSFVGSDPDACYFPFSDTPVDLQTEIIHTTPDLQLPSGLDSLASTWQDNNYRPTARSVVIDVSTNFWTGVFDLDGNPRVVAGVVGRTPRSDIGCYESQLTLCPADLTADQAVTIDDLLAFLFHFEQGQPLADLTTNGSTPFPDGGVTIDDLLFFLLKFEQGC